MTIKEKAKAYWEEHKDEIEIGILTGTIGFLAWTIGCVVGYASGKSDGMTQTLYALTKMAELGNSGEGK